MPSIHSSSDHLLPHINSKPYQILAAIYDRVMRHVEYDQWARYIKKIILNLGPEKVNLLDIGCGTGEFIRELSHLGISAEGCDPSYSMLEIARQKNPDVNFWQDQLPRLLHVTPGRFTVMTCLYDTVNYLPSLAALEASLNRIYQLLPGDGLFIFDTVSEIFCQYHFNNINEQETFDKQYAYIRNSYFDSEHHQQINVFTIYTPDGIFEERHIQTISPFKKIKSLIKNRTAFELAGVYEDFTFSEASEKSNRGHFVLLKPGEP